MAFRFLEVPAARDDMQTAVLNGLAATPKSIPPKYFYDASGSQLFEAICRQPEYAVTRTEQALMAACADEIAAAVGVVDCIIEPGAGECRKVRTLLDVLQPKELIALDIAGGALALAAQPVAEAYPGIAITAIGMDFIHDLDTACGHITADSRLVYYPGSSIGNFAPNEARALLDRFRTLAGEKGQLLIGFDLKKDPQLMHRAYNDAAGATADFNLNLLVRLNRELGADFNLARFSHYAFYNPYASRIEMHLVSLAEQTVRVAGRSFHFELGESLHTENSYKYRSDEFSRLASSAGWTPAGEWLQAGFAVQLYR